MTSYRELAEADAFHRRRLAAAFMSGSPDGRPGVEPTRTSRCVVGGLVLAAVCVLGAAASGAMSGHPSLRWDHVDFLVSR